MPLLRRHHAGSGAAGPGAPGTPFSLNIMAVAMYMRFVHAVSYQRLTRLLTQLFGLAISERALDAAFRGGKPQFDADVAAILARLRRARVVYSDAGVKHGCQATGSAGAQSA